MLRVSLEVADVHAAFFRALLERADVLEEHGIIAGRNLERPDIRILEHGLALQEFTSGGKRLNSPAIVYERSDSAGVSPAPEMRQLIKCPDVRVWLKQNTFRDYRLHNEPFVLGRQHYRVIADQFPDLAELSRTVPIPLSAEDASKIRVFSMATMQRFDRYRSKKIHFRHLRRIDISFAGLVDYDFRGVDLWNHEARVSRELSRRTNDLVLGRHRHQAVERLLDFTNLKVMVATNRAAAPDFYDMILDRSAMSLSPWGLGEYAWRDYESILSGCVLVKPNTDHVETAAPDIYQSGRYYFACKPDFSDLHDVIEAILDNRNSAMEAAERARTDLLANTSLETDTRFIASLLTQGATEM